MKRVSFIAAIMILPLTVSTVVLLVSNDYLAGSISDSTGVPSDSQRAILSPVPPPETTLNIGHSPGKGAVAPIALSAPTANTIVPVTRSKAWDDINFGTRKVFNNVWGAPESEVLTSGVYLNQDGSFGWFWDRAHPRHGDNEQFIKPIYPCVRVGGSPWDASNTPSFPIKVRELNSLQAEVNYTYRTPPEGAYNLAYDFFLSDTDRPDTSPRPNAEVMIWLQHTFTQPENTYRGDVTDGVNTYEYYSWVMANSRRYYSFLLKNQTRWPALHTVNISKLIGRLGLEPDWYLHGIELGNEVVEGSGKIEIKELVVTLNGEHL